MNNNINDSGTMAPDTTMTSTSGYSNDAWTNISPYSPSPYGNSPMNEYSNWNGYMSHTHNLPQESLNRMPPPPPQGPTHQAIQPAPPPPQPSSISHHGLPLLNTTWPSQLTNPSPPGSYSVPPLVMNPLSSNQPVDVPRPAQIPPEKARKTLSTEQKRAMCQFFEDNPGTRQADIGARFGVERSTVSKVLRQREQYLKRDPDPEPSLIRKAKGKHPDFDRTLSNYVRRQQQGGFEVKDEEIMEQAKLFAHASGGSPESILNNLTSSWLQKFKQKHGLGGNRLIRRASEANIPDSVRMSTAVKNERCSGIISPTSPTGNLSPLSETRSEEEQQQPPSDGLSFEFAYGHNASHSNTSLASDLRDAGASSFSSNTLSPTGTFTFSPDPNVGGFQVDPNLQGQKQIPEYLQTKQKRSNTYPSLNIDTLNQGSSADPTTLTDTTVLESPIQELTTTTPYVTDAALTSPRSLHRSNSSSTISVTRSNNTNTSVESSPVSPSQEDARRAATTLLNYLQSMNSNGQFDQSEYNALVRLTNKLDVRSHQGSRTASIGGLSRIPEGADEMSAVPEVMMQPN